ncbi:hypothetical protein [Laspinema palackyanum]
MRLIWETVELNVGEVSRSPTLGNSSVDARSDYAQSEEKAPSGL